MSYGVTGYAVDLDQLTAVLGSGNADLLSRLLTEFSSDMAALDEWFEDDIDEGAPTIAKALGDLVNGSVPDHAADIAAYGYAFEILCRGIGHAMYPAHLTQLSTSWLSNQPALGDLGASPGPLGGLVPIPYEFPSIGCVAAERVESMLEEARTASETAPDAGAAACYSEYITWLEASKERGVALVSFLY